MTTSHYNYNGTSTSKHIRFYNEDLRGTDPLWGLPHKAPLQPGSVPCLSDTAPYYPVAEGVLQAPLPSPTQESQTCTFCSSLHMPRHQLLPVNYSNISKIYTHMQDEVNSGYKLVRYFKIINMSVTPYSWLDPSRSCPSAQWRGEILSPQ